MAYTPNNGNVYCAAFAGALAGIVASNRQLQSSSSTTYDTFCAVAQAWAQEFDTQWGFISINSLVIETIEEASEGVWNGVSVSGQTPFNAPLSYSNLVAAVIAMIDSAGNNFAAEGITPPPWNTGGSGSGNVTTVNTFANLLATPGGTTIGVIMNGYHTPGDGGGGTFAWNPSLTVGDNIVTVLPTGSILGGWERVEKSPLNVKWAGAYGDNTHDDTAAIQAAFSLALGQVYIPTGNYKVTVQNNQIALYIQNQLVVVGDGIGNTLINVHGTGGCALLIENPASGPTDPQNSTISNLNINNVDAVWDLIVIHTPQVSLLSVGIAGNLRFGVLIESGFTSSTPGGLYGPTLLPNGTYIDADQTFMNGVYGTACPYFRGTTGSVVAGGGFVQPNVNLSSGASVVATFNNTNWPNSPIITIGASDSSGGGTYLIAGIDSPTTATLHNLGAATGVPVGGTVPAGASVQVGCMVFSHGSDSQSGVFQLVSSVDSNCCIFDSSLGGNTYIECYSQDSNIGYIAGGSEGSQFIRCGTEDLNALIAFAGPTHLFEGGALAAVAAQLNAAIVNVESIGERSAGLAFARTYDSGATYYGVSIPFTDAPWNHYRQVTSPFHIYQFNFQYNFGGPPVTPYPYNVNSYFWWPVLDGVPAFDINGATFGYTDITNARGGALAMIGSPAMNTQRHWRWKQSVTLAPGANVVYLNGGASDAGSVTFLDDATHTTSGATLWSNSKRSISVEVEYGSLADLQAGQVTVNGYFFKQEAAGPPATWNAVTNVFNEGTGPITVQLVWSFDCFVTNYDSGNIG